MRRYSEGDEERIRALRMVREWTQSRLLEPEQSARLEAELQVELRRTNPFLRAVLALFTALILSASIAQGSTAWLATRRSSSSHRPARGPLFNARNWRTAAGNWSSSEPAPTS